MVVQEAIQRGAATSKYEGYYYPMPRRSQPTPRNERPGFLRPQARNAQNFQRSYERYLALARAEALAGDRILAENYFQHAEHYLRSMSEITN